MEQVSIEKLTRFLYYKFNEGYVFEGHTHSAWEINIILSGKMSITYGGDVMTLSEGDFFIGEPWGFHCNRLIGNGAQMAVINFEKTDAPVGIGNGFSVRPLTQDEFSVARLMVGELLSRRFDKNAGVCEPDYEMCANAKKLCEVLVSRVMGSGRAEMENSSPRVQLYREARIYGRKNMSET